MSLTPVHYDIYLEPNLETFKFRGITTMRAKVEGAVTSVNLNAHELEFNKVEVDFGEGFISVEKYELDFEKQTIDVIFPQPSTPEFTLRFDYVGEHNDKLAGFYRSRYKDGDDWKYCLVTQFQANDARRAFPCVDVPGLKATFDVSFLTKKEHFCISNMPIETEEDRGEMKLVKFGKTPVMSTYLLFFGVGDFDYISKKSGDIEYRVITSPGKAEKHGHYALDFGVKVIEFDEEYFDFKYPLPKLDQIATPDFAAGAMENWGAVLYRENALLYYEGITSKIQENRILGVIAHELAHQWFGNLVSPVTWKYIWLNESFATFFANHVLDHYFPERHVWQFFVQSLSPANRSRSTSGVIDWDSMIETSPIELIGESEISFTAKTTPIIYTKGGSILRQIQAFLGDEGFRDGLRAYFKKHAYSATKSNNLWESLEDVTGMPVTKIMESFVLQKGVPVVKVEPSGTKMKFSQKRFTYLPHEGDALWQVPLTIRLFRDGKSELKRFVLSEREQEFDVGEYESYKVNADLTGYYRVQYPSDYYGKLGEMVHDGILSPIDMMHLEEDVYALLKAGEIDLHTYMRFAENYLNIDNYMSYTNLSLHLNDLRLLLDKGSTRDVVIRFGQEFLANLLNRMGYMPHDDEDIGVSITRGTIISYAILFEVDEAIHFMEDLFHKLKAGVEIPADLRTSAYVMGAKLTNDYDWFMDQFNNPMSESEFINTILGMSNFSDSKLIEKVQEMVFSEIPSRNRGLAIMTLSRNPLVQPGLWHWYLANLDSFEALNNFMLQGSMVSVIRNSSDFRDDIVNHFGDYLKKKPRFRDAYDVGLEQLDITIAMKKHLN